MGSLGMGSFLPAQLCKVKEEGIYILNTANNYESVGHRQKDRHRKKRRAKEKHMGKDGKRVNNDIGHIRSYKIS